MGWFTKKEKVPELSPAPQIPELPGKQNLPELSSFSSNSNNESIKSAVQDSSGEKEVEELPQDFHFPTEEKKTMEIDSSSGIPQPAIKQTSPTNEPIFVRIDKFQEAKKDFDEIKRKLKEIDSVLRKVKDIKSREDAEISGWSDEIEKIRTRISDIDESFFNKI